MRATPGPWAWKQFGDGLFAGKTPVITLGDDGACGDPDCCGSPTYHIEVSEENAHLLAAAPELFWALRGILEIGKRDMSNPKYDGYFDGARQALAKAEGTK